MVVISVNVFFFVLGCACLLSWNTFLSAISFLEKDSLPGKGFGVVISPVFNGFNIGSQFLLLLLGLRCQPEPVFMIGACCVVGVVAGALLLPASIPDAGTLDLRFIGTICLAATLATVTGMLQSASGALAASMLARHGSAILCIWSNGIAVSGILSFLVAIPVSLAAGAAFATYALYGVLVVTFGTCFVSLHSLCRTGAFSATPENSVSAQGSAACDAVEDTFLRLSHVSFVSAAGAGSFVGEEAAAVALDERVPLKDALGRSLAPMLNISAIYIQTFLTFPAMTGAWKLQPGWIPGPDTQEKQVFFGLVVVSLFQIFDLLGRLLTSGRNLDCLWPRSDRLWMLIAPRTLILLPCFLAWRVPEAPFGTPVSQALSIVLLAFTNGMLTNVTFLRGMTEALPQDRDFVGRVLPFVLCVGIFVGSNICTATMLALRS
jgi:hypothetical protein